MYRIVHAIVAGSLQSLMPPLFHHKRIASTSRKKNAQVDTKDVPNQALGKQCLKQDGLITCKEINIVAFTVTASSNISRTTTDYQQYQGRHIHLL